jgi:hypothetical protein
MKAADQRPRNWLRPLQSFKLKTYIYKLPRGDQKVETMFSKALLRNEKMNVSLLLQGHAAKRKLSQLFQSEGLEQANHPSRAIVTRDSIPGIRIDIEQNGKPFREICREHGLVLPISDPNHTTIM